MKLLLWWGKASHLIPKQMFWGFLFIVTVPQYLLSSISLALDHQPSWFPKNSCKEVWISSQSNAIRKKNAHRFDYSKYSRQNYPKTPQGEMQPYQDYWKNLNSTIADSGKWPAYQGRQDCFKEWTILVAMDADQEASENSEADLMAYSLWDLAEMESPYSGKSPSSGSTIFKDLVVQHDARGSTGIRRIHMFQRPGTYQVGSKEIFERAQEDSYWSPIIDHLSEDYLPTKMERFIDFISWGIRNFPAKHYVVLVWGHGGGWTSKNDDGFFHLTATELKKAVQTIYVNTLERSRPIDNLVVDSCFMMSIETISELAENVKYYSATPQVQDYLGLPYRTLMYEIDNGFPRLQALRKATKSDLESSDPADSGRKVAETLPLLMGSSLKANGLQGRVDDPLGTRAADFAFASIDLNVFRNFFLKNWSELSQLLIPFLKRGIDNRNHMKEALEAAYPYRSTYRSRDLGHFLQEFEKILDQKGNTDSGLAKAIVNVRDSLRRMTLAKAIGKSYQEIPAFSALGFFGAELYPLDVSDFIDSSYFFQVVPAWPVALRELYQE